VTTAAPALDETPDVYGAFPRLNDEQIAALSAHGERRPVQPGDVLYREGERVEDFFVILEGKVAAVQGFGGDEQVINVHGPRRFLGELSLLTHRVSFVTAVVREPGEILVVPVDRLRELVGQDPALGDVILRAFLLRRSMLIGLGAGFKIIGSRYSPECRRLRDFAARNRLPHRWIDLEKDPDAEALLRELQVPADATPVVIWGDQVLRNPSNSELARVLGFHLPTADEQVCDLVIVGAGPAGLAAAVYGASEGLATVALDAVATGGQAGTSPRIENYLGFPSGVSGAELAERAEIQAEKFGARIDVPAQAVGVEPCDGHYVVELEGGDAIAALTVLVATGVRYRKLDVPDLERFEGTSVYYAATQVEAMQCSRDPVVVVGGGNSAGQAALFLAKTAARVYLVVRSENLGRDMSRYLVDQLEHHPDIDVLLHTEVLALKGEGALDAVVVNDIETGERREIAAKAVFVFIGADPHTGWLGDVVALDEDGFVLTGAEAVPSASDERDCRRSMLQTSLPGVFAAGDVRSGSIKRVASAVGEGSMAVRLVHEYLEVSSRATSPGSGARDGVGRGLTQSEGGIDDRADSPTQQRRADPLEPVR
jgi:thioredoxin reductase (NADPH)